MKATLLIALTGCMSTPAPAVPSGPHTAYAIDHLSIPTNNVEARTDALDLNGDHMVDNQLGMVLGTIASMGIDTQNATTTAVGVGTIALVVDLQTPSFTSARAAGFTVLFGQHQADG